MTSIRRTGFQTETERQELRPLGMLGKPTPDDNGSTHIDLDQIVRQTMKCRLV
jgi:hypothetical protein